jgi:hypothetical protein
LVTLYRLNDRISLQPRRGAARVQVKLADEVTLRNTIFQGIQVMRMGERCAWPVAQRRGWVKVVAN